MKISIFVFIALLHMEVQAQLAKDAGPALTREQEWLFEKTKQFMLAKGDNATTRLFLSNYRKLLASNVTCCTTCSPSTQLNLEGKRIDESNTFIKWDVTGEIEGTRYIVERRYGNVHGAFDSIGLVEGRGAAALHTYQFADLNDYPGTTWYRLRHAGRKEDVEKPVKVEGYNNMVKVFPNPVTSTDLRLALTRFKTSGKNSLVIRDARGSVVYMREQVLLKPGNILQLQNLRLTPGVYYVQVSNEFNIGGTSFIVQ